MIVASTRKTIRYIDSMCVGRINKGSEYATKLMKKYLNEIKLKYNKSCGIGEYDKETKTRDIVGDGDK